jgi:hypothetical protein
MSRSLFGHARTELMGAAALAGSLALSYAWIVSGTRYVTTGVQFVAPLAIIVLVHVAWLGARRELPVGFARVVFARTLATAIGIIVFTALIAIYAPMPATAANGSGSEVLVVLACLVVLALVVGTAALIIYCLALLARGSYNAIQRALDRTNKPDSRLFDTSLVLLSLVAIVAASLEGAANGFSFAARDVVSSSVIVAAPPIRVWQEVGTATSPDYPIPLMLKSIPQPVAVIVDEGAAVGARRIVRFKGRQGEGDLSLRVVRRTDEEAVFQAISDTSPIANWVHHHSLSFRVETSGAGTRLTVTSDYDRMLSPAWFFRPYVKMAAFLAVDVLARDTKARSELK